MNSDAVGQRIALDLLLGSGRVSTPETCVDCPFGRPLGPHDGKYAAHDPDDDPASRYFACNLLAEPPCPGTGGEGVPLEVWGEQPLCLEELWLDLAKSEVRRLREDAAEVACYRSIWGDYYSIDADERLKASYQLGMIAGTKRVASVSNGEAEGAD